MSAESFDVEQWVAGLQVGDEVAIRYRHNVVIGQVSARSPRKGAVNKVVEVNGTLWFGATGRGDTPSTFYHCSIEPVTAAVRDSIEIERLACKLASLRSEQLRAVPLDKLREAAIALGVAK